MRPGVALSGWCGVLLAVSAWGWAQDVVLTAEIVPACVTDAATPPGCVLTPPSAADDGWTCTVDGDGCRLVTPEPPSPEPVPPPESP